MECFNMVLGSRMFVGFEGECVKKNTKNEIKKATIYRDHAHQTGRKKNILSQPGQPIVQ